MPFDVKERVKQLWRWIVANVTEHDARRGTLAPFGWLLRAEALDGSWLLEEALRLLEQGIHLDADFAVWEGLVRLVDAYPAESAGVLRMMVQTDIEGSSALGSEESVRAILVGAQRSNNAEARRRARDAINLLGAHGMHTYRDLLEPPPT